MSGVGVLLPSSYPRLLVDIETSLTCASRSTTSLAISIVGRVKNKEGVGGEGIGTKGQNDKSTTGYSRGIQGPTPSLAISGWGE